MKVYISGKITGLPETKARAAFDAVAGFLESLNFECVNPWCNGLPQTASWREDMARDITLLLGCDVVYMMEGWETSHGASIEHYVANNAGIPIMYQRAANTGVMMEVTMALQMATNEERLAISDVSSALYQVTGTHMDEFCSDTRRREMVFARMIFVYNCRKRAVRIKILSRCIRRDKSAIQRIVAQYATDYKFNNAFRRTALDVAAILKQQNKTKNEKDK